MIRDACAMNIPPSADPATWLQFSDVLLSLIRMAPLLLLVRTSVDVRTVVFERNAALISRTDGCDGCDG